MVVRGDVQRVLSLAQLFGWELSANPEVGVLMQFVNYIFILSSDCFAGHDEVVMKSLDTWRPLGVAGVSLSSEGDFVMILVIKVLVSDVLGH